jgi:hypothetical protein
MAIPQIVQQQLKQVLPCPGKTGLDWYLFCYFLSKYQNQPMLEVGVGNGGSLYTMLAYSNKVTAVDNWKQGWAKHLVEENLHKSNLTATFFNIDFHSVDINTLEKYAFVHLDANKSYHGTAVDLKLAGNLCHGIICVDDYMNTIWPEVTWAVDEFCRINSQWKKIFIGNHQIFLSQNTVQMKELIAEFPVVNRHDTWYLTYGNLPDQVMPFVESGKMQYTWHWLAWTNKDKNIL